ncbi:hypothetical protein CAI21_19705 [Alkalilimnicola ehrlichii]|uniref:PhnB-like domain-containing protein n=1 Tax=Alkalilimnicola ehrlichii TaxID=351052 RepID=A0A3E0WJY2_9GAMM|nr:VOC family protein [Alkalilimnicola ehrlichii]RFA25198.1 hypothetical protein CAI21_19705 [Alkalilimnicola ehrlichii]RFA32276.1 hypothetical protein CAL65_20125 [Alkalilimnicola ehrlichii]
MQRFSINLWFDRQAEEAANFYTSLFDNARITAIDRYRKAGQEIHGQQPGQVMTVAFELEDQAFVGLNGGPLFTFSPSISFMVNCTSIEEVDTLWKKLAVQGTPLMPLDSYPFSERYGWIQDRYGVSWQLIYGPEKAPQKIMPTLMFVGDNYGEVDAAMAFYTDVFPHSQTDAVFRYGPGQEPDKADAVAYADFVLDGHRFAAMESAQPHDFGFSEAISIIVHCQNQEEVDRYWSRLSADPAAERCGWLKDRFGISWQIIPTALYDLLRDSDPAKGESVMSALLQMKKLDIAALKRAYDDT